MKEGALQSAENLPEVVIDQWRQRIRTSTLANYHFEMGLALTRSDGRVAAIEHMRKAASLAPDNAAVCFELETLLRTTGQAQGGARGLDPELYFKGFVEHVARALMEGRLADAEQALSAVSYPGENGAIVAWVTAGATA
jgi:hypothetical protein